jgi:hypothetical protein
VASTDALISCSDHVQVWDISLPELRICGETAATAVAWACRGLTPAQEAVLAEVWERGGQLSGQEPDVFAPGVAYDAFLAAMGRLRAAMQDFLAGSPGLRTGFVVEAVTPSGINGKLSDWNVTFTADHRQAQADSELARWSVRLGLLHGQPFLEYLLRQEVGGKPLTVRVQPSSGSGHPMSYVRWFALGHRSASERQRIQGLDATELDPIVFVNNDWNADKLVASTVAQVIEWHYRVTEASDPANVKCPRPTADALEGGSDGRERPRTTTRSALQKRS